MVETLERRRQAPSLPPQALRPARVRAPCRCAKTWSWLRLRKLFQRLEEIEWPPGHAGIDASASCHFDGVMEYAAGDLGRTVERDIESEHPPEKPAGDLCVARNNIAFDVAAGRHHDTVGTYSAQNPPVNVKLAFGVETARDGETTAQPRSGTTVPTVIRANKYAFRQGGHASAIQLG